MADPATMPVSSSAPEAQKHIGREVAHELNNILTIIRGYSDRMMIKHGTNPALRPDLQLISESVKRAEAVIRHSTWPRRSALQNVTQAVS